MLRLFLLLLAALRRLILLAGLRLSTGGLLIVLHGVLTSFLVGHRHGGYAPPKPCRSEASMAHRIPDYTHFFRWRIILDFAHDLLKKYIIPLGTVV